MFVYISKYRPERRSCQLQIYQTILQTKKRPGESNSEPFYMKNKTGDDLLSQAAARQVPSAQRSLTSVFEMGTGVASVPLSPDFSGYHTLKTASEYKKQMKLEVKPSTY